MKPPAPSARGKVVRGPGLLPASLAGLLAGCPLDESNPGHCPLHAVRHLPQAEALAWLRELTTEDKAYLLQYHHCCLSLAAEAAHTKDNARARS